MGHGQRYSIVFVLFLFGIILFFSPTFAEKGLIADVTLPLGSSAPGCEENNECYLPYELFIEVGQTVTWSNDDSAAHTVTSGSVDTSESVGLEFDSSLFLGGDTFSVTFDEQGEYPYFCMVHPWMEGLVIVQAKSDENGGTDLFTIEYDFEEYVIEDGAFITLIDPSNNKNSIQQEMVDVQVFSESSEGFLVNLFETEPDSGIFVNQKAVKFSSYSTDETNLTLNIDLSVGNQVTVSYGKLSDTATIFSGGVAGTLASEDNHVTFNKDNFEIDVEVASVSIYDPDRNTNPNRIQRFDVTLDTLEPGTAGSNQVKESITIKMLETDLDTGLFRSKYFIHPTFGSTVPATYYIHADEGDTMRVTHQSTTYGEPEHATAALTGAPLDEAPTSTVNVDTTEALVCPGGDDPQDGICAVWMPPLPTEGLEIEVNGIDYARPCTPLLVDTEGEYDGPFATGIDICPSSSTLDVFLEIDYMTGHKPSELAIENVISAFANAPVPVNLHVTVDEDVGRYDEISFFTPQNPTSNDPPSYFELKDKYFGTFEERNRVNPDDVMTAKRQVFHYGMFIHKYSENPLSSGYADNANDFIVSLGAWAGSDTNSDGGIGSVRQQAGTLMHELGHNFALKHGGDKSTNCKPNYLSLMSYSFQFPMLNTDLLDYSHSKLPTLNESNLNENNGIGSSTPAGLETIIGDETSPPENVPTGEAINWNDAGDATDTGVQRNINYLDGVAGCEKIFVDTIMSGHNDWANLQYVSRALAHFSDGAAPIPDDDFDTLEITEFIARPSDVFESPAPDVDRITPDAKPQQIYISNLEQVRIKLTGSAPFGQDLTSFEIIGTPVGGTVQAPTMIVHPNTATTRFTPDSTFERQGSFDFIVTTEFQGQTIQSKPATVNIILNSAPVAEPKQVSTIQDTELEIILEAIDPDGDELKFLIDDSNSFGYIDGLDMIDDSKSKVTFIPDIGFIGTDSFSFVASDGKQSSPHTLVTIDVTAAETIQQPEEEVEEQPETDDSDTSRSTIAWYIAVFGILILAIILLLIFRR